jgi:hypothetical protein
MKGRKFQYEYQFVSRGKDLLFRGLAVYYRKRAVDPQDWETIVFMYPNTSMHVLNQQGSTWTRNNLPENIKDIYNRSDVRVPAAVIKAAQEKTKLKFRDVLAQ